MSGKVPVGDAPEALIEARGIRVSAGSKTILEDVSLVVHPAEIVTLIGPNGAGKTTLLRVLLGLVRPEAGAVVRRAGVRVGYVPQRLNVDPILPMTVERFLSRRWYRRVPALTQVLEEVGASGLERRMLYELSGGEFQRVLLARALLREPGLLLLDEPVQGVDAGGQATLYELIARLQQERNLGVLLVSHDLHLVMAAAHRVVCLDRHVCCSGHPDAVAVDPAYRVLFGDQAMRGLAAYTHVHEHDHTDPTSRGLRTG